MASSEKPADSPSSTRSGASRGHDSGIADSEVIDRDKAAGRWLALARAALSDGDEFDSLTRETLDGPAIKALYHDRPVADPEQQSAQAGNTASARSARPSAEQEQYKPANSPLDNRVLIRPGVVDSSRRQILDALEGGATSLELPTNATGESLPLLLGDVFLDMAGISLHSGEATSAVADALMTCWDDNEVSPQAASAEFNADPYATLARQGVLDHGIEHEIAQMTTLAAITADTYPHVTAVGIDTAIQHDAGASPRLELMAGIATASRYFEALVDSGMAPEACARQLVFRIALDSDFLMSIVKIRSLRRLWLHVLQHTGISGVPVRIVAITSEREMSTREPWMNHLRHVSASMAAVLGGVDALIVLPHDRVDGRCLSESPQLGDRLARNVALVLQEESWMNTVHDPMGGAYAAEHLTHELCGQVWQGLRDLQAEGGYLEALVSGEWQQRITELQSRRVRALTSGERVMVGVNRFVEDQPDEHPDTDLEGTGGGEGGDTADKARRPLIEPQRDARTLGGW